MAEEFRVRAERAESELEELRATIDRVGDEDDDTPGGLTESEAKALKAAHTSRVRELEDIHRGELGNIQRQHKSELRAVKDDLVRELKEQRSIARKQSREADQQRRRASNNDKAYSILQLQLDAALEKLALLDPNTAAPGGFYDPEVEAKLEAEAKEKRRREEEESRGSLLSMHISPEHVWKN